MPWVDSLKEAERVMVICNACRYCEGFCAVFPAMERRRILSEQDLTYLASLCHNCRDCYYACQYAPPHEFDLNVPRALGELRMDTYRVFSWPVFFSRLFLRNGLAVSLITALSTSIILLLAFIVQGPSVIFSAHLGEDAFYKVIPYALIVIPMLAWGLFILAALFMGFITFWRETGGKMGDLFESDAHLRALWDALRLKYLDGGGHGCNYPDDRFSHVRRWFHHLVFYGFMLCLAATTVAAIYEHFLHWGAPYPLWSLPVVLGTVGGVGLLIGTGGLLYLKRRMDRIPTTPRLLGMDVAFLVLLFLTSLTGLALLVLRETPAMGILLVVHLGVVVGLFITLPYSKFVHSIYRYTALLRNAIEESREES
ncbi:MAG: tricarballylate utilization 4Fe-4S protein TcuB [Deltaproteobacteria bacterium]|nr:MAG: tricarballylate utilization 4Fe-4S protein TcuB [Deltaproteobacteria bacterium]